MTTTRDDDQKPGLPPVPPAPVPRGAQLDLFAPGGGAGPEPRRYLATWILDSGSRCGQCGCREIFVQRQPYLEQGQRREHVGAYCAGCGRWIRWINTAERARLAAHGGDV